MRKIALAFFLILLSGTLVFYIKNGRLAFHPKKRFLSQLTDNDALRHLCRAAIGQPDRFATFKSDPVFTLFYENATQKEGEEIAEYLLTHAQPLFSTPALEVLRQIDAIGGPATYSYPNIGSVSPSSLRTLKIVHDLQAHFGNLDGLKIAEIGAGHGTLCTLLKTLYPSIQYTIVDAPYLFSLAQKNLGLLGISGVDFLPIQEAEERSFDLVISDHAFTESGKALQQALFQKLIRRSPRGYFVCNFFPKHFRVYPWKREELLKKFMKLPVEIELLPEYPESSKEDFILLWKPL